MPGTLRALQTLIFNPQNNFMKQVVLISPFTVEEIKTEILSDMPQVQ